ncbi:hypothetical protein ACLJJ6_08645 [Pediococcus siamensis]|uniref:hypothetical protein n=1 Tax=Pediococcus siamensis TaxID=381829 RepID=UPI0039A36F88
MANSELFQKSRADYLKFVNHYAAGTFLDNNIQASNYTKIALVPTVATIKDWSKLYQQFKLGEAYSNEQYWQDESKYLVDVTQAKEWLEELFKDTFKITAVGAEFLEGVGNRSSEQSVQLTEATDSADNCYYILQSGFPALEAKSNTLKNSADFSYDRDIFSIDSANNVSYDEKNLIQLLLTLVKDYFDRDIATDELVAKLPVFRACGTFSDYGKPAVTGNRLCMVLKTAHKNELKLPADQTQLDKLANGESLQFEKVSRSAAWKANEQKRLEWLLAGMQTAQNES